MTNNHSKLLFVIISTVIILIAAIFLQIRNHFFTDPSPITINPVGTSSPEISNPSPERLSPAQKELVKKYLQVNLNTLSSIPESLGGQFYLTEIIFTGTSSAEISYEDGHNSLGAQTSFSINNNTVSIENFTIISQNNQKNLTNTSSTTITN